MSQSSSAGKRASIGVGLESFRLVMTVVNLGVLQGSCFILAEFRMVFAASEERVHASPVGCVEVYEEAMMADLRFSLHPFVKRVTDRFSLSLAQVALNYWHYIVGFVCLCNMLDHRPTLGLFRTCFCLKRHPLGRGW